MSFAFLDNLNLVSPYSTPFNGPGADADRNDSSLSFPLDASALQAQLEQWTNVSFDSFDSGNDFVDDFKDKEERRPQYHSALGMSGAREGGLNYGGLGGDTSLDALFADPAMGLPPLPFDGLYDPTAIVPANLLPLAAALPAPIPSATPYTLPTIAPAVVEKPKAVKAGAKKRRQSTSSPAPSAEVVESPALVLGGDDELNALALEEDKRRRNTAASGASLLSRLFGGAGRAANAFLRSQRDSVSRRSSARQLSSRRPRNFATASRRSSAKSSPCEPRTRSCAGLSSTRRSAFFSASLGGIVELTGFWRLQKGRTRAGTSGEARQGRGGDCRVRAAALCP